MSDDFTGGGNSYLGGDIKGGATAAEVEAIGKTEDLNVRECQPGKESGKDRCMTDVLARQLVGVVLDSSEKTGNLDKDTKTAIVKTNKEDGCKDTDCTSESLAIHLNSAALDDSEKDKNKREKFLGVGPSGASSSDRKEWLSNGHIDENIMHFYCKKWNVGGKHEYKHMDFHMCGFMKEEHEASGAEKENQEFPTELGKINLYKDVVQKGYKYFGCVLNVDTYDNGGKHWVALFVDIPKKTLEYFDSVGRPPFPDVTKWMEKAKAGMPNPASWKIAPLNRFQHQRENWDCGLFACFYIIKRVQGVPFDAFHASNAPLDDTYMGHEMRKRFFRLKKF
jgi:hypothetical protein